MGAAAPLASFVRELCRERVAPEPVPLLLVAAIGSRHTVTVSLKSHDNPNLVKTLPPSLDAAAPPSRARGPAIGTMSSSESFSAVARAPARAAVLLAPPPSSSSLPSSMTTISCRAAAPPPLGGLSSRRRLLAGPGCGPAARCALLADGARRDATTGASPSSPSSSESTTRVFRPRLCAVDARCDILLHVKQAKRSVVSNATDSRHDAAAQRVVVMMAGSENFLVTPACCGRPTRPSTR